MHKNYNENEDIRENNFDARDENKIFYFNDEHEGNPDIDLDITGAFVFKGKNRDFLQLLFLANKKGKVPYKMITSPDKKLYIEEQK